MSNCPYSKKGDSLPLSIFSTIFYLFLLFVISKTIGANNSIDYSNLLLYNENKTGKSRLRNMFQVGQIWKWKNERVIIDRLWTYWMNREERLTGRIRKIKGEKEIGLFTIPIDLKKEKKNMTFIGEIRETDYLKQITDLWHQQVPETNAYEVCGMEQATHVIFTPVDLSLAREEGKTFTAHKVYKIGIEKESGDFYIIDDQNQIFIGFDLFIPCEYLRKKQNQHNQVLSSNKVISLSNYIHKRKR